MLIIAALAQVMELDNLTYYQIERPTLVKYYTPYCSHCQTFAPTFQRMSEERSDLVFAQINCYKNREICQAVGIVELPTIRYFVDGVSYTYRKERTRANIFAWVSEMNQPFVVQRNKSELETIMAITKTFGYIVIRAEDARPYEQMLAHLKGSVALSFERGEHPGIRAVQEGKTVPYVGDALDGDSVVRFIEAHIVPFCPILTPDLFGHLLLQNKQLILLSVSMFDTTKQLRSYFHDIAADEQAVSEPQQIFAIMNNRVFDSLIYMFQGSEAPTVYILYDKDVYKTDIGPNAIKSEMQTQIRTLRAQIANGTAQKLELRQNEQNDQQQANIVRLINAIIAAVLVAVALFAIWFACKCIRKGAVNDDDDDERTEPAVHQQDVKKDD